MEEKLTPLFQPDVLLPYQYWKVYRRNFVLSPEKKLMLAILEDALAQFQEHVRRRDALFAEIENWISDEDNDWPFSFVNVCEGLGLDPAYLRQNLPGWKNKKLASRARARPNVRGSRKAKRLYRRGNHGATKDNAAKGSL